MYRADTIVARATPPGRGAVAIVRLSGRDAFAIADGLFEARRAAGASEAWRLVRGTLRAGSAGEPIDDALVVRMPAPRTYTGEDVVEFHCHGSPLVVERVIASALAGGARAAERGEFTRRAVLNGRLDLAQAEAVADLIEARLEGGARAAWEQLQGALSEHLGELRRCLVEVLSDVEANVDFSEDDLPEENVEARLDVVRGVGASIERLLGGFVAARRQREGYSVVLCGCPNVGKSSIVNALLGYPRMIVSDEAGTTRDSVEEVVDLGGLAFVLTDTAGLRDTAGVAESAAVEHARATAEDADIAVVVVDGSRALGADDRELLGWAAGRRAFVVVNKTDLAPAHGVADRQALAAVGCPLLRVSALSGEGCDELGRAFVEAAQAETGEIGATGQPVGISRVRHRDALERARMRLLTAAELLVAAGGPELVAFELRAALGELASITDPVDNEEVLDRIFGEFCIGK